MKGQKLSQQVVWAIVIMLLFVGCGAPAATPTPVPPTEAATTASADGIWTTKADMPTGRWELSTCVVDGKIYAIGGAGPSYQALRTLEVYDPVTDP
jgi:hypothetical protein